VIVGEMGQGTGLPRGLEGKKGGRMASGAGYDKRRRGTTEGMDKSGDEVLCRPGLVDAPGESCPSSFSRESLLLRIRVEESMGRRLGSSKRTSVGGGKIRSREAARWWR
jgi:hypothetical protein